jgi:hypothetical protein
MTHTLTPQNPIQNPSTTLPEDFLGYPIATIEGTRYINVGECHSDARDLQALYNSEMSKETGLRAASIDVLPDQNGFFVRLDNIKK